MGVAASARQSREREGFMGIDDRLTHGMARIIRMHTR
jgi:hypothetical protein